MAYQLPLFVRASYNDQRHEAVQSFRVDFQGQYGFRWSETVRIIDDDALLRFNRATGALTVHADTDAANEDITLDVEGAYVKVTVNGEVRRFPTAKTRSIRVLAGNGHDTVYVRATPTGVPVHVSLEGGNDRVYVGNTAGWMDEIRGALTVDGGTGSNNLYLHDHGSTANRTFSLNHNVLSRTGTAAITYTNVAVSLQAGSGSDTLDIQHGHNNYWHVTGNSAGYVTWRTLAGTALVINTFTFAGVENLAGGPGSDDLVLHPNGSIAEFNGGTGIDRISGRDVNTGWRVTGANRGDLRWTVSVSETVLRIYTVEFTSVEELQGGTQDDTFYFSGSASLAGSLNGGRGIDTLDYSAYNRGVTVNLAAGTATGIGGLVNIQHVIGSPFSDVLTGNAQSNLLMGLGGADTLSGGDGRDLLIGGAGADHLSGGGDDDILIGGTTTYDTQGHVLRQMLEQWARTDLSYATRVGLLKELGVGSPNRKLNAASVLNDGVVDTLFGDLGTDWFWSFGDTLSDRTAAEQVN